MSIFNTISSIISGVSQVGQAAQTFGSTFGIKELSPRQTAAPTDVVTPASFTPGIVPIAASTRTRYDPSAYNPQHGAGDGLDYGKYIKLAAKAGAFFAENWTAISESGVGGDFFHGGDVSANEQEQLVKLALAKKGVPAASDLGQAFIAAGAKTKIVTVRYTDGTSSRVEIVPMQLERRRVKRRNITRTRLTDAAWVMRKLYAQQKLGKKLTSLAKKLEPTRRHAPAKPARRR